MPIKDPRTSAISSLIADRVRIAQPSILVVGCGSGREAAILANDLDAKVIGIDIVDRFDDTAAAIVRLHIGDATDLDFEDESFDIIFSYHALEHIPQYHKALAEFHRVLKPTGIYCIGTPNRARLLGYLGGGSTLYQKISWNLIDWQARFRGRFRNEFGAHAGYTSSELRTILLQHFSTADNVSTAYYKAVYSKYNFFIQYLAALRVCQFVFPSVYFIGTR